MQGGGGRWRAATDVPVVGRMSGPLARWLLMVWGSWVVYYARAFPQVPPVLLHYSFRENKSPDGVDLVDRTGYISSDGMCLVGQTELVDQTGYVDRTG